MRKSLLAVVCALIVSMLSGCLIVPWWGDEGHYEHHEHHEHHER